MAGVREGEGLVELSSLGTGGAGGISPIVSLARTTFGFPCLLPERRIRLNTPRF